MNTQVIRTAQVGNLAIEILDYSDIAGDMPRYAVEFTLDGKYDIEPCETIEEAQAFFQAMVHMEESW